MKKVQLEGILDEVKTMADKTLKLVFRTQELPPEDAGILLGLTHNQGYCLFASEELQESDIPKVAPTFDNQKSQSTRQRNTLFVYWKQQGSNGDFDTYYKQYMEKRIDEIKAKLEPDY